MTASGLSLRIKRKSWLRFARSTGSPALILCALTTMSLWAAWRKMWVSFTTLKLPDSIISRSTFPGPTLGSWSTSPTRMSRVPTFTALSRECMRLISTIDISSMMMTSASRGFSSFLSKCIPMLWAPLPDLGAPGITGASLPDIPTGTSSSIRWMVLASYPVASVIRLAARPVGAARRISIPSISKYRMIVLMVVVLPVPGPPVITSRPLFTASYTAFSCSSSR